MRDPSFVKSVVFVNSLVPLTLLIWDASNGQLGANRSEAIIHTTGMMALVMLVLTLAITPMRKITGWNWLSHFRRMLGLFAFFYGVIHLLSYLSLDENFDFGALVRDTFQHRFIFFGMFALVLMVPLALTSTNGSIKRMGAVNWKRLHMLVYPAAGAGAIHFYMQGKIVTPLKTGVVVVVAVLLGYRLVAKQVSWLRKRPVAAAPAARP